MRHIFITGVSTGIGFAAMNELLKQGYHVHGTVRNQEDQERLQSLSENLNIYQMDVTNSDQIKETTAALKANLNGEKLSGLINNSGIAVAGPLEFLKMDDFKHQFEVNVFGTLNVTQNMIPLLNEKDAYIINISSKSGLFSLPFTGAYSASKYAIEAMTDSMRREMSQTGIKFVLIEPGAVKTPIWEKADQIDLSPYEGTRYESIMSKVKEEVIKGGRHGASVEKLAELIVSVLSDPNPKTRYRYARKVFKEITLPLWLSDKKLDKLVKKKLYGAS